MLVGTIALVSCGGKSADEVGVVPPLRSVCQPAMGASAATGPLRDREFAALLKANFDQVTPENEMKMRSLLRGSGILDFTSAERFIRSAQALGMNIHGHTLIWHAICPDLFASVRGYPAEFGRRMDGFVGAVMRRLGPRLRGMDVVNEVIAINGDGFRPSPWLETLGPDFINRAFVAAHAAAPKTPLFINENGLERSPRKRAALLRLTEQLLKAGVPVHGIGTQSHLSLRLERGEYRDAMRDLASLGLPIHISELDISIRQRRSAWLSGDSEKLAMQADIAEQVMSSFMLLPASQRYAVTLWGLRDSDSWLVAGDRAASGDRPLAFSKDGTPKPMAASIAATCRKFA